MTMNQDMASTTLPGLTFFTLETVAEMTCLSLSTLRRAVCAGKLSTHTFGRSIRVSQTNLETFLAEAQHVSGKKKKLTKSMTGRRFPKTSA